MRSLITLKADYPRKKVIKLLTSHLSLLTFHLSLFTKIPLFESNIPLYYLQKAPLLRFPRFSSRSVKRQKNFPFRLFLSKIIAIFAANFSNNRKQTWIIIIQTPPPTPPLEGRGETPPDLPEGEELAGALSDGDDGAAAPLPSRGGVGGGVCNFSII